MARKPNPLLLDFLDKTIDLPEVDWETVPAGVNPEVVWEGYDEGVEGWVPVWFPTFDTVSGKSYGEFERASLFNEELERILIAMHRWPPWGSTLHKKHTMAFVLLQLYCELMQLCPRIECLR